MSVQELAAFRARVREVLSARYPLRDPDRDDERLDIICRAPDGHGALVDAAVELQQLLAGAGLTGVDLPREHGGQGLTPNHQMVLDEELARFDTPTTRPLGVGPNLAAGTILRDGTDDQKRRYLPPIARGEERWCQLFSEPDAGSDLASLRTRAEVDGDSWVVNGQKVWSSYAEGAAFALLLARTDADAPKPQAGITMFILPMTTEGVTVRPLVDMGGGRHFNEVFLEEVVLGPGLVIGEVNHGWGVANGTLGRERRFYMGGSGKGRRRRQAVELATRHGRLGEPSVRQAIASVHAAERMLEWLRDRLVESVVVGGHPAAGSMMKMAAGTLEQRVAELGAALAGMDAAAWDRADRDGDIVAHSLAVSRQATIAGGTHQIQRNILGERLLGLPR